MGTFGLVQQSLSLSSTTRDNKIKAKISDEAILRIGANQANDIPKPRREAALWGYTAYDDRDLAATDRRRQALQHSNLSRGKRAQQSDHKAGAVFVRLIDFGYGNLHAWTSNT